MPNSNWPRCWHGSSSPGGKVAGLTPEVGQELTEIRDGIQRAHRDLRELANGIYPTTLAEHGLAEAVRSAMARMSGPVSLVVSDEVEGARYPQGVEGAAYMFVLEGLANAVKHAGDTAVSVQLITDRDRLVVTVSVDSDEGIGFAAGPAEGPNLTGLRDRLAVVGGHLDIASTPGAGTRLRGVLPVGDRVTG